jgi:hypothetical protein
LKFASTSLILAERSGVQRSEFRRVGIQDRL